MSKTRNEKKRVFKQIEDETLEQSNNIDRRFSRHPKSHKKSGLRKELKYIAGNKDMQRWRWRFGERDEKSDRLKGIRKAASGSRRSVMKRITRNIIKEEEK